MKCNVERLIEALVGAEIARERKAAEAHAAASRRAAYVVSVSRGYGALGGAIAQALADALEVRCCDRVILQEVAQRANVDVELLRRLDERVSHISSDWWKSLFSGKSYPQERYLHHLAKVILNIYMQGGVILGRGAHLILGRERCFRVRVVGSPARCAERVAEREGIDFETADKRVAQVDADRAGYIRELYGVDADDSRNYDLVINTDRFAVDSAVSIILAAMRNAGYELPVADQFGAG